jgi:type II secretory pathway component PulF
MTAEHPTELDDPRPRQRNLAGPASATACAAVAFLLVLLVLAANVLFVPKFKNIFEDFGTTLPSPTILLIGTSDFFVSLGYLALPLVLLAFIVLLAWIWKVDWRSGLTTAILLALLMLAYGIAMILALFLPIASLVSSAGAAGP